MSPAVWLRWWSESAQEGTAYRLGVYLGVYFLFSCLAVVGAVLATWYAPSARPRNIPGVDQVVRTLILRMVSRSGLRLHLTMLQTVLKYDVHASD